MKISQAQKNQNRLTILHCAVSAFCEKGFENVTMKEIAKLSQLSEPAIYRYFPTKETLTFTFFEHTLEESIQRVSTENDFETWGFCEKLQALLETHLERLEKNRPFVKDAFQSIFVSDLPSVHTGTAHQQKIFLSFIQNQMRKSHSKGEFSTSPLDQFFSQLLWDYYVGILYYWLKDDSDGYTNTSVLIDKTLALLKEFLATEILSKIMDIGHFLIRQHVLAAMGNFNLGHFMKTTDHAKR